MPDSQVTEAGHAISLDPSCVVLGADRRAVSPDKARSDDFPLLGTCACGLGAVMPARLSRWYHSTDVEGARLADEQRRARAARPLVTADLRAIMTRAADQHDALKNWRAEHPAGDEADVLTEVVTMFGRTFIIQVRQA